MLTKHHGNHLTIHVCQVIVMYTLNLHSAVGKLYLNKTERIEKQSRMSDQYTCTYMFSLNHTGSKFWAYI